MSGIEAIASVVDGIRHRTDVLEGEPAHEGHIDLVCGVVDELTQPPRIERGTSVTQFQGLITSGNVIEKSESGGMDFYRFQPDQGEGVILPTSFKGTSGGGFWRIYTTKPDAEGAYSVVQLRLAGVAFWEEPTETNLHIVCHGQRSIYHLLYERIKANSWSSN
jgi:hypothetical protein